MRLLSIPLFMVSLFLLAGGALECWRTTHSLLINAVCIGPGLLLFACGIAVLARPAAYKRMLLIGGVGCVLCFGLLALVFCNTNLRYHDALSGWRSRGASPTAHFPSSIPSDAKSVYMHADGRPILSASVLQLSYKTSQSNIEKLDRQLASGTYRLLKGTKGWCAPHDVAKVQTPPIRFYTSEWPDGADLPADFNVYMLHFEGQGYTSGFSIGNSCGVAVSTKRNQVIYWTTEWFIS